jgi:hypothetical protein
MTTRRTRSLLLFAHSVNVAVRLLLESAPVVHVLVVAQTASVSVIVHVVAVMVIDADDRLPVVVAPSNVVSPFDAALNA